MAEAPYLTDEASLTGPHFFGKNVLLRPMSLARDLRHRAEQVDKTGAFISGTSVLIYVAPPCCDDDPLFAKGRGVLDIAQTVDGLAKQDYGPFCTAVVAPKVLGLDESDASWLGVDTVVPVGSELSHGQALNMAAQAMPGTQMTVVTKAGARFATTQALRAAAMHVIDNSVGVFGAQLPDERSSRSEALFYGVTARRGLGLTLANRRPYDIPGFLAADRSAFCSDTLRRHPFDDLYGSGDGKWGRDMPLDSHRVTYEPALSVQHAAGLGPVALLRQTRLD